MSMVDSVLLVVDAMDGPMPQTRFVTKKAFANGLKPIVVINKVDRHGARPDWVVDQVFDLFVNLDATDEQLDFPIIYASALNGIAGVDHTDMAEDMTPLYQAIVDHVSAPQVELEAPFQMQISQLDYNNYPGVIGIGRIKRGKVKPNQQVTIIDSEGKTRNGKVGKVLGHPGLERIDSTGGSGRHHRHHRPGRTEHLRHHLRHQRRRSAAGAVRRRTNRNHVLQRQHLAVLR